MAAENNDDAPSVNSSVATPLPLLGGPTSAAARSSSARLARSSAAERRSATARATSSASRGRSSGSEARHRLHSATSPGSAPHPSSRANASAVFPGSPSAGPPPRLARVGRQTGQDVAEDRPQPEHVGPLVDAGRPRRPPVRAACTPGCRAGFRPPCMNRRPRVVRISVNSELRLRRGRSVGPSPGRRAPWRGPSP